MRHNPLRRRGRVLLPKGCVLMPQRLPRLRLPRPLPRPPPRPPAASPTALHGPHPTLVIVSNAAAHPTLVVVSNAAATTYPDQSPRSRRPCGRWHGMSV